MDAAGMDTISSLISTLGFPIFVSCWMLFKSSKDSQAMAQALQEMRTAIVELKGAIQAKGD